MFNSEKFIETAIESVLLQTFKNFELILIDDCSTDSTLEIVSKYDDPRIKIVRQIKNSGESSSRNLGIKVANGKYIYFMDHDDAILEKTIEIFYNAAEESQADVVYMNSWYNTHDANFRLPAKLKIQKQSFSNPTPRFLSSNLLSRLQNDYMRAEVYVTPWLKIQRLDFLRENQIYFPATTLNGDVLFNFTELCFGKKLQVIDSCCYVRRIHPARTMDAPIEIQIRKAMKSMPLAIQYLRKIISKIQIPEEFRINIEREAIYRFFGSYITQAYHGKLPIEKIDSILSEVTDSDLTRVLINTLATRF